MSDYDLTLTELANRSGSDKGDVHNEQHNYTTIYDLIFYPFKTKPIIFLELGLKCGVQIVDTKSRNRYPQGYVSSNRGESPSVQMWQTYFTKANVVGFDCSDFSEDVSDRFEFVKGDLNSEADIQQLIKLHDTYDIIIDDGSHASHHQQLAFKVLWQTIPSGGLYVIEDLHWQPKRENRHHPGVPKTDKFLKTFFKHGKYMKTKALSEEFMNQVREEVQHVSFFGNKLAVFRKR